MQRGKKRLSGRISDEISEEIAKKEDE